MIDNELEEWAYGKLEGYTGKGQFLLLEQEGGYSANIPISRMMNNRETDTACLVEISAFSSTVTIKSTRNLSAFLRRVDIKILFALEVIALAGYALSSEYDSRSGEYTIIADVYPIPVVS